LTANESRQNKSRPKQSAAGNKEKIIMLSIQTNVAALYGEQNLNVNTSFQQTTINRLTSGYRINSSADDPAGLAIANALRSERTELTQGIRNANDGISQLQIIDGGMQNISQILDRLKTLAVQGASSSFTGDNSTLANEIKNDLDEVERQANNVGMGGSSTSYAQNLSIYLGGGLGTSNGSQIGSAAESVNLSNSTVGTSGLGLSTLYTYFSGATVANLNTTSFNSFIAAIASAVVSLGKIQGTVGAGINQLNFAINLAQSQVTNYAADESRIRDADIATEAANLSKAQTLVQSSMAALAQANSIPQSVLKLLQ
jgi:flagellin